MEIRVLDPATAGGEDLRGCHEVVVRSAAIDTPGEPPMSFEHYVGRLKNTPPDLGPTLRWIAGDGGRVVGTARASFPASENDRVATLDVTVHPGHRRRRVGTDILRAVLPVVRERGRTVVDAWGVKKGASGDAWTSALGFRCVHSTVLQAIRLTDADRATPPGCPDRAYRLDRWIGAAPERLVESYARARSAIHDAPTGEATYRSPDWTTERVRAAEAELERLGIERYTVVAIGEAGGGVVGLTEVEFHPHRSDRAYQGDTAVLHEHRGHHLGVAMKSQMLGWLEDERPGLREIYTSTGSANVHMIRVNHELGFEDVQEQLVLETGLAELSARLEAGRCRVPGP
jgi:RimJ/RimL family protein N-acetyltransferase